MNILRILLCSLPTLMGVFWYLTPVQAAGRPNILFICIDDLKPLLGCYGDPLAKTPNLDRLAGRSVRFERAYCNQAVCAPSRNTLLTGLRSQTLGIYDLGTNFRVARLNAVTLPQYFKQHGYKTSALGKIFHVGHGNYEDPVSWSTPHWKLSVISYALPASKSPKGLTREEALFANEPANGLPRGAAFEAANVPDAGYPDGAMADEAILRLQDAAAHPEQPFFLALGFVKPHMPFCAPGKYWDQFSRQAFPLATLRTPPEGAPRYAPTGWGEVRAYRDMPESGPLPEEIQREMIHGYYAATSYMDAQLGRVLDEFDRLKLGDKTIIMLWGDHGWHLGDHGMWSKHTNYEQATHIPVLLSAPGGKTGVASHSLLETVDLYPTLCELAGLPVPEGLDGRSAAATLDDPAAPTKDHILHVFPRSPGGRHLIGRAVRTARYRLVEWKVPGAAPDTADLELYDFETDPGETKNLAAEQPRVVAELRAILAREPEAVPQIHGGDRQKRNSLFNRKDTNFDNALTRDEFLAHQPDPDEAPQRFVKFDRDQNGSLSREEFVLRGANSGSER